MCISSSFLSLLSSGQPGGRIAISCTSAIPGRYLPFTNHTNMSNNRHDFTKKTAEILGRRVGFLCSNPNCRRPTLGSHEDPEKSASIGIAAHITAASYGGPRYDETISEAQRKQSDNGIWLCSNCATLIDKDPEKYTVEILHEWKDNAEIESSKRLLAAAGKEKGKVPFLEVDLIWGIGGRWQRGFSPKNVPEEHDGQKVYMMGPHLIYYWDLDWNYNLVIYNNSTVPAYNVKIESIGKRDFKSLTTLPKVNNIPALEKVDLEAKFIDFMESTGKEADVVLSKHIPDQLDQVTLRISYYDDERNLHSTIVTFHANEVTNTKE
jgi:hypothetical protein